jgi:hypothetical protein
VSIYFKVMTASSHHPISSSHSPSHLIVSSSHHLSSSSHHLTIGAVVSIYFKDPEGNRVEVFCNTEWCRAGLRRLGLGRIVASETEAPNMSVNLV